VVSPRTPFSIRNVCEALSSCSCFVSDLVGEKGAPAVASAPCCVPGTENRVPRFGWRLWTSLHFQTSVISHLCRPTNRRTMQGCFRPPFRVVRRRCAFPDPAYALVMSAVLSSCSQLFWFLKSCPKPPARRTPARSWAPVNGAAAPCYCASPAVPFSPPLFNPDHPFEIWWPIEADTLSAWNFAKETLTFLYIKPVVLHVVRKYILSFWKRNLSRVTSKYAFWYLLNCHWVSLGHKIFFWTPIWPVQIALDSY